MNAGLLFRVGLHLLGIWWLYTAIFNVAATLYRHRVSFDLEIESGYPLVWAIVRWCGVLIASETQNPRD